MELLELIRKSQRISHSALDDVLMSDIHAAARELSRVGVNPYQTDTDGSIVNDEQDNPVICDKPLILKAIELYAKGMEDFEGKGDKYMLSFEKLRDAMSLSGEYNA